MNNEEKYVVDCLIRKFKDEFIKNAMIDMNKTGINWNGTTWESHFCFTTSFKLTITTYMHNIIKEKEFKNVLDYPVYLCFLHALKEALIQELTKRKMLKIKSACIFYPVGQGLMCGIFQVKNYSVLNVLFQDLNGLVYFKPITKLYLYDCGSFSSTSFPKEKTYVFNMLASDCSKYNILYLLDMKSGIEKYIIDTMLISHFDCDHFNGLGILSIGFTIKNMIYPYCKPLDQIYRIMRQFDDRNGSHDLQEDYLSMMLDPGGYLQTQASARRFIELWPNPPKNSGTVPLHTVSSADGLAGQLLVEPGLERKAGSGEMESTVYRAYLPSPESNEFTTRSVMYDDGHWREVITFYVPDGETYDHLMELFFDKLMEQHVGGYNWDDKNQRDEYLYSALLDLAVRKQVRDVFGKFVKGSVNLKSLCFGIQVTDLTQQTGCTRNLHFMNEKFYTKKYPCNTSFFSASPGASVLLTGDTEMMAKAGEHNIAQTLLHEMQKCGIDDFGCVLVPHHGSQDNLDKDTIQILKAKNWVTSYGRDNTFGHPNDPPCGLFGIHYHVLHHSKPKPKTLKVKIDESLFIFYETKSPIPINDLRLYHCNDDNAVICYLYHQIGQH